MAETKKAGKKLEIKMKKSKETKGTWAFEAEDDTAPVTNLYFRKAGLDKIDKAESITVTIEAVG